MSWSGESDDWRPRRIGVSRGEGRGEELPVGRAELRRYARPRSAREPKHRGIDARRRREGRSVETADERDVVPGSPVARAKRRGPDGGVLRRELPLNDHIRLSQRESEDRGADRRGSPRMRRTASWPRPRTVPAASSTTQRRRRPPSEMRNRSKRRRSRAASAGIAFDHEDRRAGADERLGERACASTDLHDQVAASNLGLRDDVGCEPATAEEVLADRSPLRGSLPDGHGTSPSSSS